LLLLSKMNQIRILPPFSIRFNITFRLHLSGLLPSASILVMICFCTLQPLSYLFRYCFFVRLQDINNKSVIQNKLYIYRDFMYLKTSY
jgi:hypothetical protein